MRVEQREDMPSQIFWRARARSGWMRMVAACASLPRPSSFCSMEEIILQDVRDEEDGGSGMRRNSRFYLC